MDCMSDTNGKGIRPVRPAQKGHDERERHRSSEQPLRELRELDRGVDKAEHDRQCPEAVADRRSGEDKVRHAHSRTVEGEGEHGVAIGVDAEYEDVNEAEHDEDGRDDTLAIEAEALLAYKRNGRHALHPFASSCPSAPWRRARRWNSSRTNGGAATKSTMSACMTVAMSTGICVWACIVTLPALSEP